jgi:hypothetical protein
MLVVMSLMKLCPRFPYYGVAHRRYIIFIGIDADS